MTKCCSKKIIKKIPDSAMATFLRMVEDKVTPIVLAFVGYKIRC